MCGCFFLDFCLFGACVYLVYILNYCAGATISLFHLNNVLVLCCTTTVLCCTSALHYVFKLPASIMNMYIITILSSSFSHSQTVSPCCFFSTHLRCLTKSLKMCQGLRISKQKVKLNYLVKSIRQFDEAGMHE